MTKYILIFLLFNYTILISANNCNVIDTNGKSWDLSAYSEDQQVRDPMTSSASLFGIRYIFNMCKDVQSTCKGNSVFEILEVMGTLTETCEIVGKMDQKTVTHVKTDDGAQILKMTWIGGDTCYGSENPLENGSPKKAQFEIVCDNIPSNSWEYVHIDGLIVTRCSPLFRTRGPAGCEGSSLSSSLNPSLRSILIWGTVLVIVYLIIGCLYNMHKHDRRGLEAIPHINVWMNFPETVSDGARKSMDYVKDVADKVKSNLNINSINVPGIKTNQPYETV